MFGDLMKDLRGSFGAAGTRVITVAKPFCSPARDIITGAFQPYGIKMFNYHEEVKMVSLKDFARRMKVELRTFENLKFGIGAPMFLPAAIYAHVTVSAKAAHWAEYVLLRTGKLYVPGAYVDRRNEEWASKHNGHMPPAWNGGKPTIEATCSAGVKAWEPIKDAMKKGKRQ